MTSELIGTEDWLGADTLTIGEPGFGVLAENIPSSGDSGAGFVYNDLVFPGDAGKEVCGRVTALPSAGTLFAYENTSFEFYGAPDGVYTFTYTLYVDGTAVGSADVTLIVGPLNATAVGAVASGTMSTVLGSATGSATATVTIAAVSLSVPSGVAAGSTAGSGSAVASVPVLTLVAPVGSAYGTATAQDGSAFGQISAVALGFPVGSASAGSGTTSGVTVEDILNAEIENGLSLREVLRLLLAVAAGDATGLENGSPVFKSQDGSKNRVVATYASGNRTINSRDVT